jgi:hypothetical protein
LADIALTIIAGSPYIADFSLYAIYKGGALNAIGGNLRGYGEIINMSQHFPNQGSGYSCVEAKNNL